MLSIETTTAVAEGRMLPLMEEFYTIQGEGYHTGTAAYFIRLGGCDVGCHWCDVKESWNAELHPPTAAEAIVTMAEPYAKTIVVTGGEPLTWDMTLLTQLLHDKDFKVHIETSGAYKVTGKWDWFCLSPKKNKLPVQEAYDIADELKVIIHNKHDFIFAEEQAAKTNENAVLFLQPEWSRQDEWLPLIIDYVKRNPRWRISLQTHKFMQIP
jgi:organic radical activating enzyme